MLRFLPAFLVLFVASAAQAAGDGEDSHFWFELFNLALLFSVLIYFARKPILEYLSSRRADIQTNIERSEKLLTDAQDRLAEWEAKAMGLEAEVAQIKADTKRAAEKQGADIVAAAEVTAERIRVGASAVVDRELYQARESLRQEAADLAVEMASRILVENVNDADRSRLVDEFIGELERGDTA
jgi:F-type H+-transporting ATPase subunit b